MVYENLMLKVHFPKATHLVEGFRSNRGDEPEKAAGKLSGVNQDAFYFASMVVSKNFTPKVSFFSAVCQIHILTS